MQRPCVVPECGQVMGDYDVFYSTPTPDGVVYRCPRCQFVHTDGREGMPPPPPPTTKVCRRCKTAQPLEEYTIRPLSADGRGVVCAPCRQMFR